LTELQLIKLRRWIGFASYRSASAASQALASLLPSRRGGQAKDLLPRENPRNLPCGRRDDGRAVALLFWPNEPDRRTRRGGSVTHQPNEPNGQRCFPQTNPTSANEANGEIIVKTMFEHEQHDAGLFGRRAPILRRGVLAKRTRPIGPSPVGRPRPNGRPGYASAPNEPNGPTDNDVLRKQSQLARKQSQSGKSDENNA
jgi:hypothetical protein